MADILPTITESDALATLRGFFLTVVNCEVIQSQENRVSMPKGDFIAFNASGWSQLNVPVDDYTDTTHVVSQGGQLNVQVDCYGAASLGRATTLIMLLRDSQAADYFDQSGYDMQALYAEDAQQIPIVTGQNQYLERWTFTVALQINQSITLTTETANALDIGLINVDAVYPA